MNWTRLGLVVAALAVVSLAVGVPARVGYVTSGSMTPTLTPGDGFVVVTVDDPETGDIVTYRSPERGGLVTHRVVAETPDGYVTKGDANPSTDQAAGLAPVDDAQVVGTVLAVGGHPVVLPGLGKLRAALSPLGVAAAGLASAAAVLFGRRRSPKRRAPRVRDVLTPLLGALTVCCLVALLASTSVHPLAWTVTADHPDGAADLPAGETVTREVTVHDAAPPMTHAIVDTAGMTVLDRTTDGSAIRLTVRLPARDVGPYESRVRISHYPAVLPASTLSRLHAVHPLVALGASVGAVVVPIHLLAAALVYGRTPIRLPATSIPGLGGDRR